MTPGGGRISVTLCRDPEAFAALEPEWNRLYDDCPTATPFQSHAWLHSWWRSYGADGRLRVILVRSRGTLIGAAPLTLTHGPMPLLVPMGGRISDHCDVLVDGGDARTAIGALELGLRRAARHAVIDLREVRPGAAAERLYESWTGARARLPDSVCMELPAAPVEELAKRMTSSSAQRVRAKLRKIDALKIEVHRVPEAETAEAVAHLLRLHELQWRGRGVNPEHLRPRFAAHLVRATRAMARRGEAALTEYRLEGEVVAAALTLRSKTMAGGYLFGADPALRDRKADVATMLLRHDAQQAVDGGQGVLSLLRGAEPYKSHWRPETVTNQRLLLAPAPLEPLLRLHEGRARLRERAVVTVRERLPAAREWRDRLNSRRAAAAKR